VSVYGEFISDKYGGAPKPREYKERQQNEDEAYTSLMNFFCNEWTGESGMLKGCKIELMAANSEAWTVFSKTGPQAGAADVRAAMKMSGVRDIWDCWQRVSILADEFRKGK